MEQIEVAPFTIPNGSAYIQIKSYTRLADNRSPPIKDIPMGVRASETGVTLKFFKQDGTPDPKQPDVRGQFAFFFSVPRPEAPGDPDPIHGSPEWLTDIIVVDNPSKLMTKITPTQTGILLTSAASKRVVVQWNIDDGPIQTRVGCFTISKGHPPNPLPGNPLFAETVAVIHPSPSQITDISNSSLILDWNSAA
jgi:hypothetical protein